MLRKTPIFALCFLILGCVAPVKVAITVDQTCALRKIRLEQATLRFIASLYNADGEPVVLTATALDGTKYTITVPPELMADLGEIRKQSKSHDAVCSGPAKIGQ